MHQRAFKKLGIQTTDLLAVAFSPINQSLNQTNNEFGCLKEDEFVMFWSQVQSDIREATLFLLEMLSRLTSLLEKDGKAINQSINQTNNLSNHLSAPSMYQNSPHSPSPHSPNANSQATSSINQTIHQLDSYLATINFLICCIRVNWSDIRIKNWLENSLKHSTIAGSHHRGVKDIARMLSLKVEMTDSLGPLIIGCSTLHTAAEFQRMANESFFQSNTDENQDIGSIESCFYYSNLISLCNQSINQTNNQISSLMPLIVEQTIQKTLTLTQQMRINQTVATTTLCALMHMIKQFLAQQPIDEEENSQLINQSISTVNQFYHWPQPYGSLAFDCLNVLHSESQWPGEAMRQRIMRQALCIPFRVYLSTNPPVDQSLSRRTTGNASAIQAINQAMNQPNSQVEVWTPALFYFWDSDCAVSQTFARLMDLIRWKPFDCSIDCLIDRMPLLTHEMMATLMLNLMFVDRLIDDRLIEALNRLTGESMVQVFNQSIKWTREVVDQFDDSQSVRREAVESIKDLIHQLAVNQSPGDACLQAPDHLPNQPPIIPPYVPSLPETTHISLPCRLTYEMINRQPADCPPYPTTPAYSQLYSILETYTQSDNSSTDPSVIQSHSQSNNQSHSLSNNQSIDQSVDPTPAALTLRIVIAGNDSLFHSFLCAYLLIQQAKPEWFRLIDCLFVLLPWRSNNLSGFIASHDSWYARHVAAPFRAQSMNQFITPALQRVDYSNKPSIKQSINQTISPPGHWLRQCVEQYANESDGRYDFVCWQVEAWLHDESVNQSIYPDHVVPFLQRVEVQSCTTRNIDATPPEVVIAHKKIALSYVDTANEVESLKLGMNQAIGERLVDESAVYSHLVLATIPWKKDPQFTPRPNLPGINVSTRLHRSYQRSNLKPTSIGMEGRCIVHEMEITCTHTKDAFNVNLDGQTFGPYHRVRISPIRRQNKLPHQVEWKTFPIQTFFPIEL